MATIAIERVSKSYSAGQFAVRELSLAIPDGCFAVLVGPSGCGKSTTLRMIAGLEECTEGTISIGERVVNDVPPKDRDIAMVFQNYALYPHMTVRQNLSFALKMRKTPKAEIQQRVANVARMLEIEPLLDRRPRQLSGGQRQRVAVGRAIVREPKAFLFDEPLSNLDARLRVSTRAELKSLHQRLKTTTVYVTHDQEEAMTLGEMVVVMEGGRVQQVGPPLEVYQKPTNRFVAGFVGSPPMNFVEGRLEGGAGGWRFEGPGGLRVPVAHARGEARACVLGFRPQALGFAAGGPCRVKLVADVVELLGDVTDVTGRLAAEGHPGEGVGAVARLPAREGLAPGRDLELELDLSRIHVFEPGPLGARIGGGAP